MSYRTSLPLHETEDDKPKRKVKSRMQRLTKKYVKNLEKSGEGKIPLTTKKQWRAKGKARKADEKQQNIIANTERKLKKAKGKNKTKKAIRLAHKAEKQKSQSVRGKNLKYNPRKYG
tara:strand:- start:525 stop:875 length:351 start_codon:yes stop_codon:yes gene_type:complete